jgi:hypothetical protein
VIPRIRCDDIPSRCEYYRSVLIKHSGLTIEGLTIDTGAKVGKVCLFVIRIGSTNIDHPIIAA